jgi:hypothetical protein
MLASIVPLPTDDREHERSIIGVTFEESTSSEERIQSPLDALLLAHRTSR